MDDICTEGNAFEAARAYIENTGAKAICLGWLKTIRRDYNAFAQIPKLKPYEANLLTSSPQRNAYWFNQQIRNEHATADLGDVFDRYYKWQWPRTS